MSAAAHHLPAEQLDAGLDEILGAPADHGRVELIVRRPAVDAREVLNEATLDSHQGLVGDSWPQRESRTTKDRSPDPAKQVTVMNARVAALVAGSDDRRALAGDQLYIDLDISHANLPAGTRLAVGEAVIEVSEQPHLGCHKFAGRFGRDALKFVNSATGKRLRLRGLNARIVTPGVVRVGDEVRKLSGPRASA